MPKKPTGRPTGRPRKAQESHEFQIKYVGSDDFSDLGALIVGTDFSWAISEKGKEEMGFFIYEIQVGLHPEEAKVGASYRHSTAKIGGSGKIVASTEKALRYWKSLLKKTTRVEFSESSDILSEKYPFQVEVTFLNEKSTKSGKKKTVVMSRGVSDSYYITTDPIEKFVKEFDMIVPRLIRIDFTSKGLSLLGTSDDALYRMIGKEEIKSTGDRIALVQKEEKDFITQGKKDQAGASSDEDFGEEKEPKEPKGPSPKELKDIESEETQVEGIMRRGRSMRERRRVEIDEDGVPKAAQDWIKKYRDKQEKQATAKMSQKKDPDRFEFSAESKRMQMEGYTLMDTPLFTEGMWAVSVNPLGDSGWITKENIMQGPSFPWKLKGNFLYVGIPDDYEKDKELDSAVKKLTEAISGGFWTEKAKRYKAEKKDDED